MYKTWNQSLKLTSGISWKNQPTHKKTQKQNKQTKKNPQPTKCQLKTRNQVPVKVLKSMHNSISYYQKS